NPASERLHESFGFARCGTYHRAGFKFGAWLDVGYWEAQLSPAEVTPGAIRPVADVWPAVTDLVSGALPTIRRVSLVSPEARALIAALDAELTATYPEPGATHFRLEPDEVDEGQGGFFVAELGSHALGCGAIRRLDPETVEVKRMFVAPEWRGLGLSR